MALLVSLLPAAVTVGRFVTDKLGANPIEAAMNQVGLWTLIMLLATLTCTPLKIVLGWHWPLLIRRLLGLVSFFYACSHFLIYLVLDQFFDWQAIGEDIVKRKFITVGLLALVLLIPLAVTSTNKMVRRLGFPRWKRLHRLVYVVVALGLVHFVWRVKADLSEPLIYIAVFVLLLAVRLAAWWRASRSPS